MSFKEIYERISKETTAPKGKYRLVAVDKWDLHELGNVVIGDFEEVEGARWAGKGAVDKYGEDMEVLLYDDKGDLIEEIKKKG